MFWHRTQVQRFTPPVSRALSLSLSRHALGRSVGWLLTGVAVGFFCFSHGVGTTAAQESETSLKSQLDKMSEQAKQRFPAEMLKTMEDAIDEVRESDLVETAKKKGDQAIDATLKDASGNDVTLSEQWKQGPVVLMWYRGGWCPYCNLQLQAMNRHLKSLESTGAKLIVVTPELTEKADATAEKNGLTFPVLHDPHNALAKKYGLVFKLPDSVMPLYRDRINLSSFNGDESMELPLAATYVIDTNGKIRYAFLDEDYKKRAEPSTVISEVRKLVGPPQVGQVISDFTLPGLDGNPTSLSAVLEKGPVVWVMLRGYPGYQCPICSRQVASLISQQEEIKKAGASVVMVYPGPANESGFQLGEKAKEFTAKTQLPDNFHFLVDSDYQVTNLYGLRWDAPRETAYPTTLVVDDSGVVAFAKISKTHGGRSDVSEVLEALVGLKDQMKK